MRLKLRKNQSTVPWEQVSQDITTLEIIGEGIDKLRDLSHLNRLQSLYLNCPALHEFPSLPTSVKVLKIKNGRPSLEWLEHISLLKELVILQLSDTAIESLPQSFFAGYEMLETLDLKGNQLQEIPASFEFMKSLSRINLDKNKLQTLPSFLFHMKQINHLSLDANDLTDKTLKDLHQHFGIWF